MKRALALAPIGLGWCVVLSGGLLVGCGGSADDLPPPAAADESTLIRDYLQRVRDISPERISIRDDRVYVDDDSYFEKAPLLDELALSGFDLKPGLAAQGYYYDGRAGQNFAPRATPTYFRFTADVPTAWRGAFRQATQAWASASSTDCVSFIEGTAPSGVSQITIGVGDAGTAADGNPAEATSSFPFLYSVPKGAQYRLVGRSITIGTAFVGELDADWRLHTALHEVGHTLGFTHPWDGVHISGTAANANAGCCSASYFTVMDYFGDKQLSQDDLSSLAKTFPKRVSPGHAANCSYVPIQ